MSSKNDGGAHIAPMSTSVLRQEPPPMMTRAARLPYTARTTYRLLSAPILAITGIDFRHEGPPARPPGRLSP